MRRPPAEFSRVRRRLSVRQTRAAMLECKKTSRWEDRLRVLTTFLFALLCLAAPALGADKPIKVGVLMELSGTFGTSGKLVQHGFQYVLQQHGGMLGGQKVDIVTEDTAADPAT